MSIDRNIPQVIALRERVETYFGKALIVHSDFIDLVAEIEKSQHQHISETTLERVWGYSTRGYNTISLHTLDVLTRYVGYDNWINSVIPCKMTTSKSLSCSTTTLS